MISIRTVGPKLFRVLAKIVKECLFAFRLQAMLSKMKRPLLSCRV